METAINLKKVSSGTDLSHAISIAVSDCSGEAKEFPFVVSDCSSVFAENTYVSRANDDLFLKNNVLASRDAGLFLDERPISSQNTGLCPHDKCLLRKNRYRSSADRDLFFGKAGLSLRERPLLGENAPLSPHNTYLFFKIPCVFLRFSPGIEDFLPRFGNFSEVNGMKNILNRGFAQLTDDAFVTKVKFIIAQLTGNAYFPTPTPTVAAVQTKLDAVTAALTMPNPQARDAAVAAARSALEQVLDDLADNLESTALMDPVKLATTGFDLRKETVQTGEAPGIPQNVRLRLTGTSGEAQVLVDAVDRAKGYEVQTAPDPTAGPWTTYDTFSSVRGIVLRGFPRAKDLWVRARTLGPNNTKSGWSDPAPS